MSSKLLISLTIVVLLLGVGCIEIDKEVISTVDFSSEARFVNLSRLGSATVQLEDVNISFGSLSAGEASSYKEIDAGSRKLVVTFSEGNSTADITMSMVFATEKKSSVFILGDTSGTKFINAVEHYTFDAPPNLNANWTHSDSAIVRVLNGLPDFEEITVSVVGDNSEFTADALLYGKASSYNMIFPGDYAITVAINDSTVMADTLALLAGARYTVAIYDEVKGFIDD